MAVKSYEPQNIRNLALVGHGGCGKTSLAEAMLFVTGATTRLGKTMDRTSILDFEPEEQKRGGSMATALAWCESLGVKLNILDCPGDQNFYYDTVYALRGADAAVVVVSAPDGIEVNTERYYNEAVQQGLPVAIYVNKMDRERADPERALAEAREVLGAKAISVQIPIGREHSFKGVCSLFGKCAYVYPMDGSGKYAKTPIPEDMKAAFDKAWERLVEDVASTDEVLMTKYLDGETLTDDEIRQAFQKAMMTGEIVPLIYGCATECVGALSVAELAAWAFPNPMARGSVAGTTGDDTVTRATSPDAPFLGQVLHTTIDEHSGKVSIIRIFSGHPPHEGAVLNTTRGMPERLGSMLTLRGNHRDALAQAVCGDIVAVAKLKDTHTGDTLCDPKAPMKLAKVDVPPPMMSLVLKPATKNDEDKLKTAVERVIEEDPTLSVSFEDLTHQMVLLGMGQQQIELACDKMKRKYKVSVETELPPVPYRETIKKRIQNVEGKHKKQTGGAGQYGVAFINVAPTERGHGFEFVDMIVGGTIPRQYIPSVEKGVRERMKRGPMAGYPVVDVRVELVDGKYHPVDSKDVAFQMAGSKGMRTAFEKAGGVLLEPIYEMEINVPTESMGDVMGDITSRRGRIIGMEPSGRNTTVKASAPLAEVQRYAADLRAMTGGKGVFTMKLASYEEVPSHLVTKLIDASPFKVKEEDDD